MIWGNKSFASSVIRSAVATTEEDLSAAAIWAWVYVNVAKKGELYVAGGSQESGRTETNRKMWKKYHIVQITN